MDNSTKFEFFKTVISRYIQLNPNSLLEFFNLFEIRKFKKNEIIITFGQIETYFNILVEGIVVSYSINKQGKIYHKNIFFKENFLGSTVSALKNQKSDFELKAITDCIVLSCHFKEFKNIMEVNLDIKDFYIAYLEQNWIIDKEKRELDIVFKDAKERYLEFISEFPEAENNVPIKLIASHLGITPTQLSRIRSSKIKNRHM